jgi:hypothetical protein
VLDADRQEYTTLSLFPEDRIVPHDAVGGIQVRLSGMELRNPRVFGNCWLGCQLWRQLGLDEFWQERLFSIAIPPEFMIRTAEPSLSAVL